MRISGEFGYGAPSRTRRSGYIVLFGDEVSGRSRAGGWYGDEGQKIVEHGNQSVYERRY